MSTVMYVSRDMDSKDEKLWKNKPVYNNGIYSQEFGHYRVGWLGFHVPEGCCQTLKLEACLNNEANEVPRELWGVRTGTGKLVFTVGKPSRNVKGLDRITMRLPEIVFSKELWTIQRLIWLQDGPEGVGEIEGI